MSITNICNEIAEKIPVLKQKGYEEGYAAGQEAGGYDEGFADGKKEEHDTFWDAFFENQKNSKRIYAFEGGGWNEETFTPNRTINRENLGVATVYSLFGYTTFVVFPEFLSDGVTPALDTSGFTLLNSLFANADVLKEIKAPICLDSCTIMNYAFSGATKLEKVTLKNVQTVNSWVGAFNLSEKHLTDIGQESDDFGYFSASVNLSKTAILFNTDKMSLRALITSLMAQETPRQEDCFLLIGPPSKATLTINSDQKDQIDAYMKGYSDGALGFEQFQSACATINWSVLW